MALSTLNSHLLPTFLKSSSLIAGRYNYLILMVSCRSFLHHASINRGNFFNKRYQNKRSEESDNAEAVITTEINLKSNFSFTLFTAVRPSNEYHWKIIFSVLKHG